MWCALKSDWNTMNRRGYAGRKGEWKKEKGNRRRLGRVIEIILF